MHTRAIASGNEWQIGERDAHSLIKDLNRWTDGGMVVTAETFERKLRDR